MSVNSKIQFLLFFVLLLWATTQADYYLRVNGQSAESVEVEVGTSVTIGIWSTDAILVPEPTDSSQYGLYHGMNVVAWNGDFSGYFGALTHLVYKAAAGPSAHGWTNSTPFEAIANTGWSVENPSGVSSGQWFDLTYTANHEGVCHLGLTHGSYGQAYDFVTVTVVAADECQESVYGLAGFAKNWLMTSDTLCFEQQYDHVSNGMIDLQDFAYFAQGWGHQNYFVSVDDGDDQNPGTESLPFKTIEEARNQIRSDIAGGMTSDIRVYIRKGLYFLDTPIQFGVADSGRNGFEMIYRNFPGETPQISAGQLLTGWQLDAGDIYKVNVGVGCNIEALFENGQWSHKARSPNSGYFAADTGTTGSRTLVFKSSDLSSFDTSDATVYVWPGSHMWNGNWSQNYNWVANIFSVDTVIWGSRTFTLSQDTSYPMTENNRYYVQGAKELLDTPGEWYLDKSTGWLYYWPYNTSVENQKIVGATGKRAIEIVGDDIFTPVKNLSFEGLIIKMSNSYHQYKPWWGDDWDGMVYLENAEFITFNRCRLSHAGTNIFYLGNHIQNCQITNNMIEEFGNFGISGKGLYPGEYTGIFTLPQQAHIHKFNLIHNNRIRDGGRVVGSGSGIWLYHSGDNTITNNLIENMPRLGIHFYGQSWQHDLRGRTIYGIPVTWENRLDFNYTRNNYIAFNEMINCMYDAQDGGAYYTWGTGVNNVVENNFVHDMAGLADGALMGIYLDDATNFTTVRKNVVTRLSGAVDVYPFICKGQGNLFTNNVSANNDSTAMTMVMQTGIAPDPDGQEPTLDNAFFKNISYENGLDHTFLVSKPNWQDSYINEMISGCDDNLWYHPSGSYNFYTDWRTSRIWAEWLSFGMGTGSITVQDPLFSNPGNDDYSLQTGSPALGLGIESIDLSDVGLNDDFPF